MKNYFSHIALIVLFTFGCSNETLDVNNDQLIAYNFLKVISSPNVQSALYSNALQGKTTQAKSNDIAPDSAYIIVTDFGLVFVQFDTDKVFAFLGVNPNERIKEKNGEVLFDTRAKKVYCIVGDALSRTFLYNNLCPDASPDNASGLLVANGRLMPADEVILDEAVEGVQSIFKIGGAGIINAKDVEVDNTHIELSSGGNDLDDYFSCGDDGAIDKVVYVKSERDTYGNNIELQTSIE